MIAPQILGVILQLSGWPWAWWGGASLAFTRLHWRDGSVCMWAYVRNACWTTGDMDVRLKVYIMMGIKW